MKFEPLDELLAWQAPKITPIIGSGLLLPETKMILYGRYKSWKSMIALHTGMCIANGKKWFGFTTNRAKTFILQSEIPKAQYQKRADKYVKGNSIEDKKNLLIASEPYIKLEKGGYFDLEKELLKWQPGVVIVDPIYKVVSGRITDEYDMRQFTDKMDILISKYHFSLILIHHDRKQQVFEGQAVNMGSQDMFGTSIFLDWCDTAIKIEPQLTDAEVRLVPDVVRHAEDELKPFLVSVDRQTLRFRIKEDI
jgi:RecA-family ATPase